MMATETQTAEATVAQTIANFTVDDLWSPKKISPLFALGEQWIVDSAIYDRRFWTSRQIVLKKLDEIPIQSSYTTEDYSESEGANTSVPQLLKEYDDIRNRSKLILDPGTIHSTNDPERQMLHRFGELKKVLQERGVIVERWEKLVDILTDFDFALRTISMNNSPVSSAENELLEPIARYLAAPEIQSSYVTRFLSLFFLIRLQKEIQPWVKPADAVIAKSPWIILVLLVVAKYVSSWIIAIAILAWPIAILLLCILGAGAYTVSIRLREDRILGHLIAQFQYLRDISKIDGRVLKHDLKTLRKLGLTVPSLLFSLFDITLPGS